MQGRQDGPTTRGREPSWRARGRDRGRGRGGPTQSQRSFAAGPSRGSAPPAPPGNSISSFPGLKNARATVAAQGSTVDASNQRRMNLMASVSRSSGLEKDGDDLKNYRVQEEYRSFIQGKVSKILQDRTQTLHETEAQKGHIIEAQQNILILFRKLREGVASTNRKDRFALEVYETSLYLSILFESPAQTVSILPHLFLSRPAEKESEPTFLSGPTSIPAALCAMLHQLVAYYPSQGPYMHQMQALSHHPVLKYPALSLWLRNLAKSLRTRNYTRFSRLTDNSAIKTVTGALGAAVGYESDLGSQAALVLICALRKKASESAWAVIRSAYRDLSVCDVTPGTSEWLERSLCLDGLDEVPSSPKVTAEHWLVSREPMGHVRRKPDADGRWLIYKAR